MIPNLLSQEIVKTTYSEILTKTYTMLCNLNWEINDPNVLREKFQIAFNYVADIHAPLKSRKVRNRKAPWLTMGRRLFIYYLIQKSLIILMICETIQKKWIVY